MTAIHGAQSTIRRAAATAAALALLLLILPAAAEAGSGGVGPGGSGSTGPGGVGPGGPGSGGGPGSSYSGAEIDGVSRSYAKFSLLLATKTDLSLRVVGAWTLAEGGPKDNPLNIGPGRRYGTVRKGVRATSALLRHSRYRRVMASTDDPDGMQIRAIAASPWCPGCRGYKRLLRSSYRRVSVKP